MLSWRARGTDAIGRGAWIRASNEEERPCDADEGVRWCDRAVGIEKPEPDKRGVSGWTASWVELAADVDEVLETTEAFWAARRRDSSRVKRLTYIFSQNRLY